MNGEPPPAARKSGTLLLLAAGATLVLVVGSLLRPVDRPKDLPVTLTEATTLRALSRRDELRQTSSFLADRAAAVGRFLVYLPDRKAGGVVWGSHRTAITSSLDRQSLEVVQFPGDSAIAATVAPPSRVAGRGWVLVAARQQGGTVAWSVGMHGGTAPVGCAGNTYRQLVLSVPLSDPLLGAGVFDLDENLLAVVTPCDDGLAAIAVNDLAEMLERARADRPETAIELVEPDSVARRYFAIDRGVLVSGVRLHGEFAEAGLRPGDVVVAVDSMPARTPGQTLQLLRTSDPPRGVSISRSGSIRSLPVPATPGTRPLGVVLAPAAPLDVAAVTPGSPAARAGLRPGDQIVRLGSLPRFTRATALAALERAEGPVYLVFRRGEWEHGVFLFP